MQYKQLQANEGRDYTIYAWSMDAATPAKWESIKKLIIPVVPHARIIDKGAGTALLTEHIAREYPQAFVHPQDISPDLQERQEKNHLASAEPISGDVTLQCLNDNSVDVEIYSSVIHEVHSFGGPNKLQETLRVSFNELVPGGQIIIRDFKKPESKTVLMRILGTDGFHDIKEASTQGQIDYNKLSTRALFDRFYAEFQGGNAFDYQIIKVNGVEYIELNSVIAHEFYLHKDYTANWRQEIKETYTYWTQNEAKAALTQAGFTDIVYMEDPNEYILTNRLYGKIELYERDIETNTLNPINFPSTHMIVSGRKPYTPPEIVRNPFIIKSSYDDLIKSISINHIDSTVSCGDRIFQVQSTEPMVGTKKRVFHLKVKPGEPQLVLKVVLEDKKNQHGMFKAIYQSIKRIHILEKNKIPSLPIVEYDQDGPPYRWYIQETVPQGGVSAVDLIRNNQLTEHDVMQMCTYINTLELSREFQIDTNPFNWYRIYKADHSTEMTYIDGKVYLYDERWTFSKIGLIQWINEQFLGEKATNSAHLPTMSDYESLVDNWTTSNHPVALWFKKYLHPTLQP